MTTTITDTGVDALRARFSAMLSVRVDAHIERLSWDGARFTTPATTAPLCRLAPICPQTPFPPIRKWRSATVVPLPDSKPASEE